MEFLPIAGTDVRLSRVALGGHEYLPNGNSRGFNEDFAKAITPGHSFPGFGGDKRKAVLKAAYDIGVNFFDVTLDAEKEALGRNLAEMPPPYEVYVQTRPEAMAYSYDPGNRKMTDLALLRAEVQRILKVLRRERLELLNLGILRGAIDGDPDFVAKLAANIRALQKEGLILFAAADTFSGETSYTGDDGQQGVRHPEYQLQHRRPSAGTRDFPVRQTDRHARRGARGVPERNSVSDRPRGRDHR